MSAPRPCLVEGASLESQALAGSGPAWDALIARHQRRVLVTLLARGLPLHAAQEISQEAWLRLIAKQRAGALRELRLPALAVAQAEWLARDHARRGARRQGLAPTVGLDDLGPSERALRDALARDPERRLLDREALDRTLDAVSRCSPRAQQVFAQVYGPAGLSQVEAAQALGISVQRARQLLSELRAQVRAILREET